MMNNLVPIEQKTVLFYDDEIIAVLVEEKGTQIIYVPLRPICDYLGIDWSSQRKRIQRDTILSEAIREIVITPAGNKFANPQEMVCLPLDFLNGWLFGITPSKVNPNIRERLLHYQRECYRVLANSFLQTSLTTSSSSELQALNQIREMGLAITAMAEQQIALVTRMDKAAIIVGQHEKRLNLIEQKLAPREAITDEQASDIAEKVRAISMALTEKDNSKNHFQAIFGELHRRYRVTSYKNVRQNQYQEVLDFLDKWLESQQQTGRS
jgi:hypothetical protein